MAVRKVSSSFTSSGESYGPAEGCSELSSQERPPAAPTKWRAGCFAKYKLGGCADPSCMFTHDLSPGEISSFLHCVERTHHVVFPDSSSETQGSQRLLDPDDLFTSEKLGYEDLQKLLRERFRCMSEATLLTKLPLTKSGKPSSMGTLLHASGRCRPCRHMLTSHSCPNGMRCLFCHQEHTALEQLVEHDDLKQNGDVGKPSRFRPSKAKRDNYKELVKELEDDIQRDPFGWSMDSVVIPPAIENRPTLKRKLLIRLALMADAARSSQSKQPAIEVETAPPQNGNPKTKDRSRQFIAL